MSKTHRPSRFAVDLSFLLIALVNSAILCGSGEVTTKIFIKVGTKDLSRLAETH